MARSQDEIEALRQKLDELAGDHSEAVVAGDWDKASKVAGQIARIRKDLGSAAPDGPAADPMQEAERRDALLERFESLTAAERRQLRDTNRKLYDRMLTAKYEAGLRKIGGGGR